MCYSRQCLTGETCLGVHRSAVLDAFIIEVIEYRRIPLDKTVYIIAESSLLQSAFLYYYYYVKIIITILLLSHCITCMHGCRLVLQVISYNFHLTIHTIFLANQSIMYSCEYSNFH